MKKKSRKARLKRKKEFRFHKVKIINKKGEEIEIWHPAYIFLEKGNVYIFITITHSPNVKEHIVVKLKRNPNPNDKRESYWVLDIKEDTKDRFGRRHIEWTIDPDDDEEIRAKYKKG